MTGTEPRVEVVVASLHPDPGPDGGHCRVTIRRPRLGGRGFGKPGDDPARWRYRSYCGGCGHEGPDRTSEKDAVEDGHDHAYPGWREMPIVAHRPHTHKRGPIARWEAAVAAAYPAGWLERQGPVLELRHGLGSRHVPGLAPGGGYLMAVMRPEPKAARQPEVQQALF
ncbi:DUF6349 family protein [Nonomuraea angiospora]|uniref:DUF6349 family protein n=1 Tax=Nonomuraea angiospora TaxID=46172 RepID=UPI0029A88A13|nr:DUF6349 family protein [Nonomuraea angiospora]MDX3100494.1 DUF6349 family protein [Nonomuraea angiospora]